MILLIDHYDSYTNNLAHLFRKHADVRIMRCDAITLKDIESIAPQAIVLSPGPGRPDHLRDVGISAAVVTHFTTLPIFGVCLGHQIIAHVFGATVAEAKHPLHGRASPITHTGTLLRGLPQHFKAMRYHSLSVSNLPAALVATAFSDDGELMAFEHKARPLYGVQFHPESIATEHGDAIARAFCAIAKVGERQVEKVPLEPKATKGFVAAERLPVEHASATDMFERLFSRERNAFLLHDNDPLKPRFSFMGTGTETSDLALEAAQRDELAQTIPLTSGVVGCIDYEGKRSFQRVDELLVLDHRTKSLIACAYASDEASARANAKALVQKWSKTSHPARAHQDGKSTGSYRFNQRQYQALVQRCIALIRSGEAYELCLTNRFEGETTFNPWDLFLRLMRRSATAYSAYIKMGDRCVLSSSPERLLRVRDGNAETRPIKGTRPRGINASEDAALKLDLQSSDKDRAENLMIVDVSRHDLGSVSESVSVPRLLEVETYPSVFQLVSTVRAETDADPWAIIDAVFPPASMTGAPKLRAVEWLRELEGVPRGTYSGALGYIDRSGNCDLAVVIRTIVMEGTRFSFGVGGAVLLDSDPRAEWDETQVKAAALLAALGIDKLD